MFVIFLDSCFRRTFRTGSFIISLLFIGSIGCTHQNESETPGYLNGIQNLVVIIKNTDDHSSIELERVAILDDPDATNSWYNDMSGTDFPFGGGFDYWFGGLDIDDFGRIYIGNRPEKTIQVFDSTGFYQTNLGRQGNGPGEFNEILDIKIRSNKLYVFDYLQFRTTVFSLDSLKLVEVQNAYLNRFPDIDELTGWHANQFKLIDGETFLVAFMEEFRNANVGTPRYNLDKERSVRYYLVNREGNVLSEMLFELMDHKVITADVGGRHLYNLMPVPFLNEPLISVSDEGNIFAANSETSLIKMYDSTGDYVRAFYIPLDKKSLIRDELIKMYAEEHIQSRNLLLHAELPKTWPALGDVITDDENRLWISTIQNCENSMYEWWVLQDTGELITTFKWPENRSIEKIKNGYVYARETSKSTGFQTIVTYRIIV